MAKASEELKNRILCYINSYTEQHGFAPSYREIQAAVGVGSTSTIYNYVKRLEAEKTPEYAKQTAPDDLHLPQPHGRNARARGRPPTAARCIWIAALSALVRATSPSPLPA